jgi:hypothetical protein
MVRNWGSCSGFVFHDEEIMSLLFGLICRRLIRAGRCAGVYCFVACLGTQMHRSSWRSQTVHHLNCTWLPGLFKSANRLSMSGQVHLAMWLLQATQYITSSARSQSRIAEIYDGGLSLIQGATA